jgi:hypothetical protein
MASKDRTGLFADKDPHVISEQTGAMLLDWLESGAEPVKETLTEQQIADHKAAIESAADMDALKKAYSAAYKAATAIKDIDAEAQFTKGKDARKDALERAEQEGQFEDIPH